MISKFVSVVSLALLASAAFAGPTDWEVSFSYSFSLDQATQDAGVALTNIISYSEGGSVDNTYRWGSTQWAFQTYSSKTISTHLAPSPYSVFHNRSEPILERSVLLGIMTNLPGDAVPNTKHAVLIMSEDAATAAVGRAWEDLFPNTSEINLISNLEVATTQSTDVTQSSFAMISTFLHGDGVHGITTTETVPDPIFGSIDVVTEHSIWFGQDAPFSIVSFSNGKVVGAGTSQFAATPVPEPASLAALGVGALALVRRRRNA